VTSNECNNGGFLWNKKERENIAFKKINEGGGGKFTGGRTRKSFIPGRSAKSTFGGRKKGLLCILPKGIKVPFTKRGD